MRFKQFLFIFLVGAFLTACGGKVGESNIETTMSETVQDFTAINEKNEKISLSDLEGDYWVANFIFTNCTTVCLPMTKNMSVLQDKANEADLDVQFVSFSIDPDFDTPEKLVEYGENFGADFRNWSFITGYEFEEIRELSIKSFKSMVQMPADEDDDQIIHGTSFYLVNPEGEVIKAYPGVKESDMDDIFADLKKL